MSKKERKKRKENEEEEERIDCDRLQNRDQVVIDKTNQSNNNLWDESVT